jgi:hypothetical protein
MCGVPGRSWYQKQQREVRKEQRQLLYMREIENMESQGKGSEARDWRTHDRGEETV